ncbi:MAG: hypothetical protein VX278_22445, partial [Myxococcota bacterium]|nr:hypothetical protein [Myxococcota bacterium]
MAIRSNRFIRYLSLFTIISFALIDATQQQWICDDAYLSLRYAENLVQGEGLTYNPGEYVEGYSNFLWTLLLALCQFLGAQPESMSMTVGIFCYAGTFLGLYRFGWVALAGGAFALHMRIYASSGLETMMFLCLITWGAFAIKERRIALYSILACASFLCRPEGGLLLLLGLIPFWQERGRYLRYILPVVGTYLLWKIWYFGDVLPNTYHAKGSGVRFNDGFRYLSLFFSMYWVALLGLLHSISSKRSFFVLSFIFCYALYLLKTGGGFMFGRLALPLYLMLLIAFEFWLEDYRKSRIYWSFFSIVAAGLLLTPYPKGLLENPMGIDGIVEEKTWYPQSVIDKSRAQGKILA